MTERVAQLSIVGIWRPSMPPSPDATIIITILITEKGAAIIFLGFWRPPCPPPPYPDATILNDLNDRERGRHSSVRVSEYTALNVVTFF